MSPEQARIVAVVLVALTALLVGFQGASTLVTVTQLGASPPKASAPKSHASLVPPAVLVKPDDPASAAKASAPVGEPVPPSAVAQTATEPVEVVTDSATGIAAAARAKAQAEMDAMGERSDEPQQRQRRYRAPRPELHKVY